MANEALGEDNIVYYLHDADSEVPHQMYTCTKCGWRMNFTICENKSNHFRHHPGANLFGIKCEDLSKHKDAWEKSEQNEALRVFCKESAVNKELWLNIQELFRGQYTQQQNEIEELKQELEEATDSIDFLEELGESWKRTAKEFEKVIALKDAEIEQLMETRGIEYRVVQINRHDLA